MNEIYNLDIEENFRELGSSVDGISESEAETRLKEFGLNEIVQKRKFNALKIFISQFTNFLVIILVLAGLFKVYQKDFLEAGTIFAIILINAIIGFRQEFKAEEALKALKQISISNAKVIRKGTITSINVKKIVPGDIVLLEEGDKVPADARLIEEIGLKVNESILTGESTPVLKKTGKLLGELQMSERKNMLFANTIIAGGKGKALIVDTGYKTEFGKIAQLIEEYPEEATPLLEKINNLAKQIGLGILVIIMILFVVGFVQGKVEPLELLDVSIALAVAAIPEGLPIIFTVSLALGIKALALQNTITRRMTAAETLGSTTVICSDKTGTLTRNELMVKKLFYNNKLIEISGNGYGFQGNFSCMEKELSEEEKKNHELNLLLKIGALCNNASIGEKKEELVGDPTEIALLVSAAKNEKRKEAYNEEFISEFAFDSDRKMMTSIYRKDGKFFAYSKGSSESILERSDYYLENGKRKKLTPGIKESFLLNNEEHAGEGLRVLGFAFKEVKEKEKYEMNEVESKLIFVGFQAMIDTPRLESKKAIEECRKAGIKVKMITGDHLLTAKAIAKELGLINAEGKAITGRELDEMSDEELEKEIENITVFARVNPSHKVRIIKALQQKKHITAMTGDGVNDAPALKKEEIGIEMGLTGTDVAKEAADIVIMDDNFATIVNAIEEGRKIFQNIKNFVKYLLAANLGEIMIIATATFAGFPLPLTIFQILWINLITDGLPATALTNEKIEENVMLQPPRNPNDSILKGLLPFILLGGIISTAASLGAFFIGFNSNESIEEKIILGRTMAFTTLVFFELFFVFNARGEKSTFYSKSIFSNKWLLLAVIGSMILQLLVIYLPFAQPIFSTTELNAIQWIYVIGLSITALAVPDILRIIEKIIEMTGNNKIKYLKTQKE